MSSQQNSPTMRRRARAAAGLLAFLCAGALSGTGPAAAASQPSGALHPVVAPGTISTIAGGIGGPAKATNVAVAPYSLALSGGHIYIAGGGAVRDVAPSGQLTTLAGSRDAPASFGGQAAASGLNDSGVAKDRNGNLVIADKHHLAVVAARNGTFYGQPMKAGNIYSVAGNGQRAEPANGAVARHAPLGGGSYGVTVDRNGNLVISDSGFRDSLTGNRFGALVEVVATSSGTFYGKKMIAGHIYTVAGSVTGTKYTGDGGPATKAGLGMYQGTVRIDQAGNLILADTYSSTVRVVAEKTGTFYGVPMKTGDIYTVAGTGFRGFSGDGGLATQAELFGPFGAAPDVAGNLVIADTGNARVRVVAGRTGTFYGQQMIAGHIYTVAGDGKLGFSGNGGPAAQAKLYWPYDVAVDAAGNLAIADAGEVRVRVVAEHTGKLFGQPMTKGDIYTAAGNGQRGTSGDGGPALNAELAAPQAVAADGAGNVLVMDSFAQLVRMVVATTGTFFGRPMAAGHIYDIAGDGHPGFSGDGGPATKAALAFAGGAGTDAAGNLLIADTGNHRIRVVAAKTGTFYGVPMKAGDIYTMAGTGQSIFSGDGGPATKAGLLVPEDVAADTAGNLVIADANRLRVVAAKTGTFYGVPMKAGDIYTVAGNSKPESSGDGGPARQAGLDSPTWVTADAAGNLVIADTNRTRVIAGSTGTFYGIPMTANDIYTVAGNGKPGFSGDGGPATKAEFYGMESVAVDGAGNLVINDGLNGRVRVVAVKTGTFYGVAMTAGDVYTVAGDGTFQFTGDGGPATRAGLSPRGAAVTSAGDIVIADSTGRVRMVTG